MGEQQLGNQESVGKWQRILGEVRIRSNGLVHRYVQTNNHGKRLERLEHDRLRHQFRTNLYDYNEPCRNHSVKYFRLQQWLLYYQITNTIEPGKAYWVKVSQAGTLTLDVSAPQQPAQPPQTSETPPSFPPVPPPAAPVLSCSNCGTADAHPSFTWTAINGAASYVLYRYSCSFSVGDCGNETAFAIASTTALGFIDYGVRVFHKGPDGTVPTTTFYYYVVTKDVYDQQSAGSNKKTVNTGTDGTIVTKQAILHPPVETNPIPTTTELTGNYPNPFNPTTRVDYGLSNDTHVLLRVFDVLGREVAVLVDELQTAGFKSVEFDASSLPSGIYVYKLQAGKVIDTKKMLLMR